MVLKQAVPLAHTDEMLSLQVDADTRVYPSSLRILVNCMYKDPEIMGLCGETTIANKKASWVTMIQVGTLHLDYCFDHVSPFRHIGL